MKRFIITMTGFVMFMMTAYSQTVTIQELINKAKCKEITCFNDFITTKGFSFHKKTDYEDRKEIMYKSNRKFTATSNEKVNAKNQAGITFCDNGEVRTYFNTNVQSQYQKLMSELSTLKFMETLSTDDDNSVQVQYSASQYPKVSVVVTMYSQKMEGVGNWTEYFFDVIIK